MGMTLNQLALVRAVAETDMVKAKKAALACCTEDTTQKNQYAIKRILTQLTTTSMLLELPTDVAGFLIMEDVSISKDMERYYLSDREAPVLSRLEKMAEASSKLAELGISYLNAILLYGESGTGKTTFGRYAAYRLGLPFAYVNFSSVINSFLGQTSQNISKIFRFIRGQRCLVMLDEIDCIGLKRGGGSSGPEGELARTTITLMQELDRLSNEHILIAATNRYDRLDSALARRFTVHHEVRSLETKQERVSMIVKFLDSTGIAYDRGDVERYAETPKTQSSIRNDIVQAIADSVVESKTFRLTEILG